MDKLYFENGKKYLPYLLTGTLHVYHLYFGGNNRHYLVFIPTLKKCHSNCGSDMYVFTIIFF